jgi:hypothetical protein
MKMAIKSRTFGYFVIDRIRAIQGVVRLRDVCWLDLGVFFIAKTFANKNPNFIICLMGAQF